MPDPVPVVDVKTLVDKLGEVYSSLAAAQAKLATREAELASEKAAKAAERDRERYEYLQKDFLLRSGRMLVVLVLIVTVVFWDSNEEVLRDLFRPRPPVDFAEHVSALVDVKDTATRNDRVRRIRDCMDVLDRLFPAKTPGASTASTQGNARGGDGDDTRIADADKTALRDKCEILITTR